MVNTDHESAPGRLETVRALLNTWLIPNDTRVATDTIGELFRDRAAWNRTLGALRRPRTRAELAELVEVRDRLRGLVERRTAAPGDARWMQDVIDRHRLRTVVDIHTHGLRMTPEPAAAADGSAAVLAAVVEAVQAGTWHRLKACPGCRWVFWDHTRSDTKIWCGMNRNGPNGRACGSIAKVQAFRRRRRSGGRADDPISGGGTSH